MDVLQTGSSDLLSNSSSSNYLAQPIMHAFSSLFLLGSYAFQTILGRPEPSRMTQREIVKRAVDDFIATEEPIALEQLLCNIGSTGCNSNGVSSGIVIASPSTSNPDCKHPPLSLCPPFALHAEIPGTVC